MAEAFGARVEALSIDWRGCDQFVIGYDLAPDRNACELIDCVLAMLTAGDVSCVPCYAWDVRFRDANPNEVSPWFAVAVLIDRVLTPMNSQVQAIARRLLPRRRVPHAELWADIPLPARLGMESILAAARDLERRGWRGALPDYIRRNGGGQWLR